MRGTIALTPASNVRIDISGDYSRDDAHLNVGQPLNSLTFLVGGGTALALPTNPTTYDFTAPDHADACPIRPSCAIMAAR